MYFVERFIIVNCIRLWFDFDFFCSMEDKGIILNWKLRMEFFIRS